MYVKGVLVLDLFLKFDVNIFSIILLVVLFFTMKLRKETVGTSNRLFFRLLWMTVILLFFEILSWIFDGVPGQRALNYVFNFAFAWLTSTVTCTLASYLDYHILYRYLNLITPFLYNILPFPYIY